jgi:hypothetical protein
MTFLQAMQRLLPFFLVAVVAWAFWPVRGGDFVIDDYVFLAQSRLIEAPLAAFWSNHFYEPIYFRPTGIVIWWLATHAFGLDYASHSLINLGLHALNVLLLYALLMQMGVKASARLAGAAVFALLPFSFAAILWPSNRFDLLAVAFLLSLAMVVLRYLDSGRWPLLALAALLSIAACLGKEIAFPLATVLAFLALAARHRSWTRRLTLFSVLGSAISLVFVYRHLLLSAPYAVGGNNLSGRMISGTRVWLESLPDLAGAAVGESAIPAVAMVAWIVVLVALGVAAIGALIHGWRSGRTGTSEDLASESSSARWHERALAAAIIIAAISILIQAPLAWNFREMLPFEPLGPVTFARFYYLPMAALAVVVAVVLMRAPRTSVLSLALVAGTLALAIEQRGLAGQFAAWTVSEIRPMAVAAAETTDAVSGEVGEMTGPASDEQQPCVVVLLDTQKDHPWFRMFSDVTVKARAQSDFSWQCHVMTETTPWLFISPQHRPLPAVGLPKTAVDAFGTALEDNAWGGVRYRYRQPPGDGWSLPGARYFAWQGDRFVEVTDEVLDGSRSVDFHRW